MQCDHLKINWKKHDINCTNPKLGKLVASIVIGKKTKIEYPAILARSDDFYCGENGNWFEQKNT